MDIFGQVRTSHHKTSALLQTRLHAPQALGDGRQLVVQGEVVTKGQVFQFEYQGSGVPLSLQHSEQPEKLLF